MQTVEDEAEEVGFAACHMWQEVSGSRPEAVGSGRAGAGRGREGRALAGAAEEIGPGRRVETDIEQRVVFGDGHWRRPAEREAGSMRAGTPIGYVLDFAHLYIREYQGMTDIRVESISLGRRPWRSTLRSMSSLDVLDRGCLGR